MSSTPPNLSRGRCHTTQADIPTTLQLCSGCRSIRYCSRDCQRRDWPAHKQQCQQGHTRDRVRTTMRLNITELNQTLSNPTGLANVVPDPREEGMGFYLKTETPHLHDISIIGPFHSRAALVPSIVRTFGQACVHGQDAIGEIVENGMLNSFEHITSPIRNNPDRTKTVRLLKEHNPHILAQLPGTVWYVTSTEVNLPAAEQMAQTNPGPESAAPVKGIHVRGTFSEPEPAIAAAREIAQALVRGDSSRSLTVIPGQIGGTTWAAVVSGNWTGASDMHLVSV